MFISPTNICDLMRLTLSRNGQCLSNDQKGILMVCLYVVTCRGETFQRVLSQVGDVCSLVPRGVSMVALTATALSMLSPTSL